jgi:hypothetical protein
LDNEIENKKNETESKENGTKMTAASTKSKEREFSTISSPRPVNIPTNRLKSLIWLNCIVHLIVLIKGIYTWGELL